jgi:hypothetical protein
MAHTGAPSVPLPSSSALHISTVPVLPPPQHSQARPESYNPYVRVLPVLSHSHHALAPSHSPPAYSHQINLQLGPHQYHHAPSARYRKACETCGASHDGTFGAGRFCTSRCARTVGGLAHRRKRLAERQAAEIPWASGTRPQDHEYMEYATSSASSSASLNAFSAQALAQTSAQIQQQTNQYYQYPSCAYPSGPASTADPAQTHSYSPSPIFTPARHAASPRDLAPARGIVKPSKPTLMLISKRLTAKVASPKLKNVTSAPPAGLRNLSRPSHLLLSLPLATTRRTSPDAMHGLHYLSYAATTPALPSSPVTPTASAMSKVQVASEAAVVADVKATHKRKRSMDVASLLN